MAATNQVDIKVKYIPDTSALKSALDKAQKIDFKFNGGDVKKELLAPVQNAMKELNHALSSGADSSSLLKAFDNVGKAADEAKTKASGMMNEITTAFNSPGNQNLLKDLKKYQKELAEAEKASANWDKKYSNKAISKLKLDANVAGLPEARKEIKTFEEQLKISKSLTDEEQQRYEVLKKYVDTWNERQVGASKAELEGNVNIAKEKVDSISSQIITNEQQLLGTKNLTQASNAFNSITTASKNAANGIDNYTKEMKEANEQSEKAVSKVGDTITGTFLGTTLSRLASSAVQKGVSFFKEYDEILTRTMMVTGKTRDEVNSLTSSYNKLANQLSSTTKDVAAAQLVFYQQGLGTQEAAKMTEASIAISKTGSIEASEAADRLTAAVRGYQLAAGEAMDIADKMSALDAAAASSVDELTVAMQKSASQARMAGLDLDYYMAYLSTMQEVTREAPENIGTAMKSITSRMQELRDIGKIEEDGTSFSNVAKALNSIGIAATDSSGQLRQLQDIMDELGPIWATLDRNHKAYIATTLAGNRQQSRFIALMDNYDRAMELVDVSQNASGESAKQLRAYNQGLEASFTRLTNAWQQFATSLADSDMIKDIVDLLSDLIEWVNDLPGGVKKAAAGILVFTKAMSALSNVTGKGAGNWLLKITGLDTFVSPIDDKDLAKMNTAARSMRDIFQNAFSAIKTSAEETKSVIAGINPILDANTGKMTENAVATEGAAAAQTDNNITNLQEVAEVGKTTESVNLMKDAYNETKTAVDNLNESMGSNSDKYLIEQQGNLQKAKNQYTSNAKERNKLVKQNKAIADRYKEQVKLARSGYEAAIKPENLRSTAIADLNLSGKSEQLALNFDGEDLVFDNSDIEKAIQERMAAIKKEYGIGYHEMLEDLKSEGAKIWDVNDPFIEDLDNQQKELKKEIDKFNKNIKKYMAEHPDLQSKGKVKSVSDENVVDTDFWGEDSDIASSGIDKVKNSMSSLTKELTMSNAMSGLVIGSMVNMGAQAIGLSNDLSSAIGTIAGVSKALSKMGTAGIAIGFAVGVVQYAINKLLPSVEEIQGKITELQTKSDELNQKYTDIDSNLKSYEELSAKIGKTDEETEQLKSSTEALVDLLPNAVSGYDSYGNAIINTSMAMEELNTLQGKQVENANKSLKQYGELQRGAQNTQKQWTILGAIIGTVLTVAGAVGTVLSIPTTAGALTVPAAALTATGIGMLTGSAGSTIEMTVDQKNENKKVIEENYNDIYSLMQTTEKTYINKIVSEHQDTAKSIMDTLAVSMLEAARTTGEIYADDMGEAFQNIVSQLDSSTVARIDVALQGLDVTLDVKNMSYDDARKYIADRVSEQLKDAGFTAEQLDSVIDVIVNIKFEAAIDVSAAKKEINKAIQGTQDNTYRVDLDRYSDALGQLDTDTLKIMSDLGLLDSKFASVYTNIEDKQFNGQNFVDIFRDSAGEINKTTAALNTYEIALGQVEKYQKVLDYGSAYNYASIMAIQVEQVLEATGLSWEEAFGKSKLDMFNEWGYEYDRAADSLKYYQGVADTAYSSMSTKLLPTFKEISQVIKDSAENFDQLSSVAENLDLSNGAMNVDSLTGLFDLFSNFEESAMNSADEWNAWASALNAVNNGLSYENGLLQLNEEALSAVSSMVELNTKAKYKQAIADIEAAQNSLRLQKTVLETEYNVVNQKIQSLEKMGEANYDGSKFETDVASTLAANLDAINLGQVQSEQEKVQKILEVNQAGFNQLLAMQQQYANGEKTSFTLKDYSDQYSNAIDKFKKDRTDNIKELITDDYQTTLDSLKVYRDGLKDQIGILEGQILQGDVEKKFFQGVIDGTVDLGKTFSETAEKASDYAEQLERVLTLLEKIDGIQHKITENETFKSLYEGYDGEAYSRIMLQNLDLAKEQYEVYKDLFDMQQERTNQAAGNLMDSMYGSMFSISEDGNIGWADNSMYDKYKNLPNDMQEDIDNLVEAYQKERDALRDTEQELAVYAKAVKDARDEIVKVTLEAENTILDTVKNREKILHDARIKALDDEIDIINKGVEARKKARENQEDAKDLAKSQEALRRATLDSSGKNNASLLQLQEELEEKQIDLSEKRFEQDMEDRTNWLNDTKDAETETYEYRLETMTWYWEEVQNIMGTSTEEIMTFLMTWEEEYRQSSVTQQEQLKEQWNFTFTELKSITEMLDDPINNLKVELGNVTSEVENMNIKISALPGVWQKATDAVNNYSNAAKKASKYSGGGGYVTGGNDNNKTETKNPETEINEYIGWVGKTLEFRADNNSIDTYNSDGTKTGKKAKDPWGYDPNVKILGSKNIPGVGYAFLTDEWTGYVPVKYFYNTGIGGKKIGKSYKTGGMVDYTGPAWVDGTKSSPEAFLNSYQTQQVGALADALSNNSVSSVTGDSNITFGSISFNVASMSSSADGKAALETFVKGANDLMAKKGISTTLNLNVK